MIRNLSWLRTEVCRLLNVDIAEPDQAYSKDDTSPWDDIDDALNEAYEVEVEEMKSEIEPGYLMESKLITWPAGQRVLTLDEELQNSDILRVDDETSMTPGTMLWILDRSMGFEPTVSWLNRSQIQWSWSGPGESKTLRVTFLPSAGILLDPIDEPNMLPPRFRRMLVWGAGILLRQKVGDMAPQEWERQQLAWRMRCHIALSKGRPRDPNRAGVQLDPKEYTYG